MSKLPRAIEKLTEAFERLPGIGPKSATRLAFYLLTTPQDYIDNLAEVIVNVKKKVKVCQECFSVGEGEVCEICQDSKRNKNQICVVERVIDVLALEKVGNYRGVYHVLGGVINPLDHVGPDDLKIAELISRAEKVLREMEEVEIILATNPTMEGEATSLYIKNQLDRISQKEKIKLTRIGSGLPMGADLEFADQATLARAMEGRRNM
jgi:recombination protein RecR